MIDIHCHILPDFDDGASTPEEALDMARMAADSGVTGIVVTPHFPGRADSLRQLPELMDKFHALNEAIRREEIPLTLTPGAEILCLPETPALARRQLLPTIGDTSYVLTEFFFNESFSYMDNILQDIAGNGYRPVVAHPERYMAIQRDPLLLDKWFREGFVLQLNKGSLLGYFGSRVRNTGTTLIEMGLAHLIASDAHSAVRRTPHMLSLTRWVTQHCSPDYADILLHRNPGRLLENQEMVPTPSPEE